jgi:predicted TIM-barrel fold metal-dependent hydrolase
MAYEYCPLPDPSPRPPRNFALPAMAVDTHAHVIGRGPFNPARGYTSRPHDAAEYLGMLDAVGLAYGVLVQPTVHGTDNSTLIAALRSSPARLRGIAVIAPDISAAELRALGEENIVGIRVVTSTTGGVGLRGLDRLEAICLEMGWHLQLMVDADKLGDDALRLSRLRIPVVIDHMGHFGVSGVSGVDAPGFAEGMQTMQSLLRDGAWVKLSGAYRLSEQADYRDVASIARPLLEAAPERCVWGSDWPQTNYWRRMPNIGELLDLLADWAPDAQLRERVLVDNAHRLYGFEQQRAA